MKKCFMLAAMLLSGITATSAQTFGDMFGSDQKGKITYGVRAGLNISNIGGEYGPDSGDELDLDSRAGFHIGGIVDIPITNGFYVQPGLLFTTRGAKDSFSYSETGYSEEATTKYKPMYLEIPVLASFRADVSRSVNVQVNVGPHFAFGLGGKCKYEYSDSDGNSESNKAPFFGESSESEEHYGMKRFDFGLTFGWPSRRSGAKRRNSTTGTSRSRWATTSDPLQEIKPSFAARATVLLRDDSPGAKRIFPNQRCAAARS